jgi:hypothetical protein
VTTKRDSARYVMLVAAAIQRTLGGDDAADLWVEELHSIAYGLDVATFSRMAEYPDEVVRRVKLRNLIDHPETPQAEREQALRALAALGGREP